MSALVLIPLLCVAVLAACFGLAKLAWREHAIFASANGTESPNGSASALDERTGRGPGITWDWWPGLMEIREARWEPGNQFPVLGEVLAVVDMSLEEQTVELEGKPCRVHVRGDFEPHVLSPVRDRALHEKVAKPSVE